MNKMGHTVSTVPRDASTRRLVLFVLGFLGIAPAVNAWQTDLPSQIDNPPLLYDGPDPTANSFLFPRTAQASASPEALSSQGVAELPALTGPEEYYPEAEMDNLDDSVGERGFTGGGLIENKDGFFQKLGAAETWIDRSRRSDYGLHEIDIFATFAVPAPNRQWPLLISPTFNTRLIDGPVTPDLPAQLYEGFVDFLWLPRLSERWTGIIGVAPSYYGDFQVDHSKAFRMTGKGLARFDWIPGRVQVLFGALYLNRNDIRILPAGGVIWQPNDAKRYELLFPRPKLAHRITIGSDYEDWLYLAGEFGGNTYAIERANGTDDFVTLRDLRVLFGLERKLNGGAGYRLEAGYVFGRRVEYDSATPDIVADDAAVLRGAITF